LAHGYYYYDIDETAPTPPPQRHQTPHQDNFSQCRDFFLNVLSYAERDRLTSNMAGHLAAAQPMLQQRAIEQVLAQVHASYATAVREKLEHLRQSEAQQQRKPAAAPLNPPRVVYEWQVTLFSRLWK